MSEIQINSLRVKTQIGVPNEERANWQELEIDIAITPTQDFEEMQDAIADTIDYAAVCERVAEISSERPRLLIETLAKEIANAMVHEFGANRASVEVRKFILPQTRHVAVRYSSVRD
jgi:FolB domain-containing protein